MAIVSVIQVGVGVFVFRNGKFLMGQRLGAHGEGTWSVPGGHPEFGEELEDTAAREVKEETGLSIADVRFGALTNDVFPVERKHYVTVWMTSRCLAGEERITEPDKYVRQGWYDFSDLPSPLFLPWRQLLVSPFVENIKSRLRASRSG
ncbi:nucleotide triphosphate diphosphatase NUDT15 [Allorhizocola rhizosphaerae]|uniref:nucleotide triphosphate diphosphatase NUDT15 n=1 Tax=Allorhizocola rhizosphaerae TaxID=1872709 RepID=UPI001B8DA889|nr:NUDIX domain-containing protein [Allorhizocola rhizosphaerae]